MTVGGNTKLSCSQHCSELKIHKYTFRNQVTTLAVDNDDDNDDDDEKISKNVANISYNIKRTIRANNEEKKLKLYRLLTEDMTWQNMFD